MARGFSLEILMVTHSFITKSEHTNRELGDKFAGFIIDALDPHISGLEHARYLENHTVTVVSADGMEGVSIIFAPTSQVVCRFVTPKAQRELDLNHYLDVGVRNINPEYARKVLIGEFERFLAEQFAARQNQNILFDSLSA